MITKQQTKSWIDFKELRSRLTLAMLIEHFQLVLKPKGEQLVGYCPIPGHTDKRTASFSAHPQKGIFQCFGCGAKGNLLDLTVYLQGGDPKRAHDLRKAAIHLNQTFRLCSPENGNGHPSLPQERHESRQLPEIVNSPLQFRLKGLNPEHPYLVNRGFARATMDLFGVGFCDRGFFQNRITIPLHDNENELIGYCGRVIDDSTISVDNPKYLFPGKRKMDGKIHVFKKSLFLYNGSRHTEVLQDLIVVEGFSSVWWLTQNGYPDVVALMGSSMSEEQAELICNIVAPTGTVWLMLDGDPAGKRCAAQASAILSNNRTVKDVTCDGKQPTDYSQEELDSILLH